MGSKSTKKKLNVLKYHPKYLNQLKTYHNEKDMTFEEWVGKLGKNLKKRNPWLFKAGMLK